MEEIVNLGVFQFDTAKLQQSLDSLQNKMFELRKAQEANNQMYRDAQKEINQLATVQDMLVKTGAANSQVYKENEARIHALTEQQKANYKVQQETQTQMGKVRAEINQTNTQLKAYITTEGNLTSLIDQGNKALQTEVTNINQARASNKELLAIRNQLSPTIKEEADLIEVLNERLDQNNEFIKENASGYEKLKMNIGNYSESIQEALNNLNPLNGGLLAFIQRSQEAGGVGPLLTGTFTALRTGLMGATKAGLAFIATPIGAAIAALAVAVGAIIGLFKFMTASMNSTEEGSQKLAKITKTISGVFEGFFKILKPIGEFLGDVFIAYIETVGEALEWMVDKIAAAMEFLGMEEAAAGLRDMKEEVKASAQAAADLAVAEGKLQKMQRESVKIQKQYEKQNEILRQQRDDTSKDIDDRIAANEKLGKSLEAQAKAELEIAKQRLEVANLRIKSEGETTEALNARAEAEGIIADIEERITGQRSEQLVNLNSLRKEAADAERERRQKAIDDAIAKTKQEIDLFVAGEEGKKKALQDTLDYEEKLSKKRLSLLEQEYRSGKKSKLEYEAEKLNITNEYALKQIEIVNQYAAAEIALYKQTNQSKIESETLLTEAIIFEEERRLNELRRMDIAQLEREKQTNAEIIAEKKARNEQLTLADIEYQTQRAAIDQQYNEQIDTNKKNFEAQVKSRDLAQQEADKELALLNAESEYEQQLIEEQARYDAELLRLDERLAKEQVTRQQYDELKLAMEKQNADNEKKINQAKEQAIRDQYATTFGNVAKLFGEKTALGKAAALAEATMNTYNGITQVWASESLLPEPIATASKVVNTGVVLASGLGAVKKIASVDAGGGQRPAYADGVIGLSGAGTGDSDSIDARLSRGESVINSRSTAMFPELLSAINVAGGGVGLNASSSIVSQNEITQRADSSQMTSAIAEAVYVAAAEGTALGSQSGIVQANENRLVQQYAKS